MDPITMLAAFGPLAVELGKGLIARFIAPADFKPATVADWLQMRAADLDLFKTMNEAGGAAPSYPWVEAVIRLQRPAVAAVALGTWALQELTMPTGATDTTANFAAAVGFYLFGDRTLFHAKRAISSATAKP
jgi:hypothetical protein